MMKCDSDVGLRIDTGPLEEFVFCHSEIFLSI